MFLSGVLQKKTVIYGKILVFLRKLEKSSIYPAPGLNNRDSITFRAFGATRQ
jgi:hypothetical protein